jgi:hypothetical protein
MISGAFALGEGTHRSGGLQLASSAADQAEAGQAQADRPEALSESQQRQVQKLKQRDREVRAHEHAHMAAGPGVVQGGASFTFQRGPDRQMYAVGGEVKIDTSAESDPDATIRKMQQVKRAALAPAEPSGTDRAVAAQAGRLEAQARQENIKLEKAETQAAANKDASHPSGSMPARRPYSAEDVGLTLNIAV